MKTQAAKGGIVVVGELYVDGVATGLAVPPSMWSEVLASDCRVPLDASGEALRQGLGAGPDLVKPNRDEVAYIVGGEPCRGASAAGAALRLFAAGARRVAITLVRDGLLWQRDAQSPPLEARPPRVEAGSAVGSGDATLAGLAVAHSRGLSDDETVRLAVACGAANCLAEAPGMIVPSEVERLSALAAVRVARGTASRRPSEVAR
jgi:fructose-1-phosphate kinase PfkB-like protein